MSTRIKGIEELEKYNYAINKWYKGKRKILTVLSAPGNTPLIFKEIIESSLNNDKKVLYLWNGKEINKELIKKLEVKNKEYSYYSKVEDKASLAFVNIENYKIIKSKYNLCIIDDITLCEIKNKDEIIKVIEYLYLFCEKLIVYNIEKLITSGEFLEVLPLKRKLPFVEPRFINTRVDLDEEIPYKVYDYLMWFKKNNKKTVILLPNEKKVNKIYDNYTELLASKNIKLYKYLNQSDMKIKDKIYKEKNNDVFIVTDKIECYKSTENINFIVIVTNDADINYKKILFLCAQAGIYQGKTLGEVIICSKGNTKDMEIAKKLCRSYNKNLWEKGLVKY